MDAVKYFKIKRRMTKGCIHSNDCTQCVLNSENNPSHKDCAIFEMQYPEEAVAAVEKWTEEHPVKTRMSDFLEKFPRATVLKHANGEYINICPASIDAAINCPIGACENCKFKYWNDEAEDFNERD